MRASGSPHLVAGRLKRHWAGGMGAEARKKAQDKKFRTAWGLLH